MSVFMRVMSNADIVECKAYDQLKDDDYRQKIKSQNMSISDQFTYLESIFGVQNV